MNEGLGVMNGAFFWMNEIIFLSAFQPYCTNHRKNVILRWNEKKEKLLNEI